MYLGSYDYCKTCDSTNPKNCGSCNDGYYLPIGNYKRYCNYCGSPKIKKCHQEKDYTIIIDECTSDYVLLRNNCVEKCDSQSYFSRCTVCNEEPDKLDQCKECKEGYYLPTDYDNTYCYYCPYPCSSCYGNSYNPTCTSCYDGYILSGGKCLKNCTIGDNNLCKSCNTEPGKIDKICRDYFNSVDKNKNGVLEFKEIKKILAKFAEDTSTTQEADEEIRRAFQQLDKNNDGKICYNEFKSLFDSYLNRIAKK